MSNLPHIAYLTSLYPAASHTFILREVQRLRQLGFQVETCSIRRPSPQHLIGAEEQAHAEQTFYVLNACQNPVVVFLAFISALCRPAALLAMVGLASKTAAPGMKGTFKQLAYVVEALVLARHLNRQNITHIHSHFAGSSATVAMLASKLCRIPFSYTLHGPADLYEPEKWHLREKTKQAQFVACISYFARSQAMYFSDPQDWQKIFIIHCGVVPERYASKALTTQRTAEDVQLLFVGRLSPVKGVRLLIEAFQRAQAQMPELKLVVVGDGPERQKLEALAASETMNVRFTGYQSQDAVADHLMQSDILVLPSFAEGLPVVLMEALVSQTPVICSQVAGVGELVEHGVSGFIVPASDVESLTKRILELTQNVEQRIAMGKAGQQTVIEQFDIDIEAARIGQLFVDPDHENLRPTPLKMV